MISFSGALTTLLAAFAQPTLCILVSFDDLGLYFTSASSSITRGSATYTPTPMKVAELAENFVGEVQAAELAIMDLDSTQRARFFDDNFRGTNVTVRIYYYSGGTWTDTTWSYTMTCDADRAASNQVSIKLSSSDAVQGTEAPRRTTQEAGCQSDYKRGGCPYRGSKGSCDKGYSTSTGCKDHFPDVTIAGKVIQQPKPFGGFLGGMSQRLVLR